MRTQSKLQTDKGSISFSWKKSLWLYFILIPIAFLSVAKITLLDISLFMILLFLTVGIGHSVGLHRGIIHKSYKSGRLFRNLSLVLFTLCGMGSPLNWLKQHYFRDYWQNRTDCPTYFRYQHSLLTDYWWNLHLSFTPNSLERYKIPNEDLKDPFILHLHKTWVFYNLLFMLILHLLLGFNSMLLLTFFRCGLIILGHWYIGYASHKFGYSRFQIEGADESGYNDIFLGLISFGEGFHNNHHSYPTSAKFSSKWHEIDFGWVLVFTLKKLRIIHQVKTQENNLKRTARKHSKVFWKLPSI